MPSGPDPDLQAHIQSLGLTTLDDYTARCARHGFSTRTKKDWRQRLKERSFANRAVADARLAQKKLEIRQPQQIIERIFRDELHEDDVTQPHLKAVYRAYESTKTCPDTQQAFLRLLRHVGRHADFSATQPVIPQYPRHDDNTFVGGLLAFARHSTSWLRPVEDWKPQTRNVCRQFASLARHLFVRWPVPACMDSVWFKGGSPDALRQQRWFLHVGGGQNIRTADLSLPYTKKMAHHFMQAPPEYTIEVALRWGQIHGLGGDARLVRAILGTRLGTTFENEDFWATVIQFFVAHPMLDRAQIGPIIDYLHHEKFVPKEVFVAPGVVEQREPPQPYLNLKGRTPASLLREVESWHSTLAAARFPLVEWPSSGIEGFLSVEETGGSPKIWTITELCSTKALVAEGREMRHCVASYAQSCAHGDCSIWTLEVETAERRSKLLTIEVRSDTRMIVQAKGKGNMLPGEKHRALLRRWAEQAGLRLAEWV